MSYDEIIEALGVMKMQITTMPRAPYGDCECCRNHAVEVRLSLTAENFNRVREAMFHVPGRRRDRT